MTVCQLLGICANRPVDVEFSFREWRHRGDRNPHGYGFAHWEDGQPKVVKAASNLYASKPADTDQVRAAHSEIFVAHVRYASVGAQDGANTHPFEADFFGRSLVFAHNGTVAEVKRRGLGRQPTGETDSEHAFLWLLDRLPDPSSDVFSARLKALADDVRRLGRFNFLLSDGMMLWAYADNSLSFVERRPPYGGELVRLVDDGYSVSLATVKRPDERAVLVATEPLTN
jgi:glutamine amidotransferase